VIPTVIIIAFVLGLFLRCWWAVGIAATIWAVVIAFGIEIDPVLVLFAWALGAVNALVGALPGAGLRRIVTG
jgi:hypothetical protein